MQRLRNDDRARGWIIRRVSKREVTLTRLWLPSEIKEPIWPDHYRRATEENPARCFDCGGSSRAEIRLLALSILLGRFDWPVAWTYHEAFVSDWLCQMRLSRGAYRMIWKADIEAWWAVKEDMVAGLDLPAELVAR